MRLITSLTNETVKTVRALHQRKARMESGLFLAEGLKIVAEAVDQDFAPVMLLHGEGVTGHPVLERAAARAGQRLVVTPQILEKICRRENPQTVLGVFEQRYTELADLNSGRVLIGLEAVRDPGNLGTIIRTADAAGASGVALIGDCCDPYSVEAVRASMGSIFAIPVVRLSAEEFLAWRKSWPRRLVGTLLSATTDFRAVDYSGPTMILFGNEQAGLTPNLADACDVAVKIPMRGRADSLNLAVAAGVMLYAAIS